MLKGIIVVFIIGCVLYAFFGIWGIIVPAVVFVVIIIIAIKNADKNLANNEYSEPDSSSSLIFDIETNVSCIPITIFYSKKDHETNKRTITIQKIGITNNVLYIRGYCNLANAERTFRVDRIIEAEAYGKLVNPMVFILDLCKEKEEFDRCALNGINFCVTGRLKIMTRKQAQERIEAYGGKFHQHIKFNTHYLVAENASWNTSKLVEARSHNIPILDEETFIDYLSEPTKAHLNKPELKDQYQHYKESVENNLDYKK